MSLRLDLDVDGRGQALVDDRIDKAAGLVVGREFGHLARDAVLHAAHVFVAADAVVLLQAGLHERGVHRGVGGVDGGEVGVDADVGHDHVQVRWLHFTANDVLDLGDVVVADFEARAAGHAHVDDELARDRCAGSRRGPGRESRDQQHDRNAAKDDARRSSPGAAWIALAQPFIPVQHGLELLR